MRIKLRMNLRGSWYYNIQLETNEEKYPNINPQLSQKRTDTSYIRHINW